MALDPMTAGLNVADKVISLIGGGKERKHEIAQLIESGIQDALKGQLKINEVEARSPNIFVSGWRPFVGWVCGAGLAYTFLFYPLILWAWTFSGIEGEAPPNLDTGVLQTILMGMLGLGGMRTVEKLQGKARSSWGRKKRKGN